MASGKEYLHFILEQLSDLDDISYRPMMGEFILYYRVGIIPERPKSLANAGLLRPGIAP